VQEAAEEKEGYHVGEKMPKTGVDEESGNYSPGAVQKTSWFKSEGKVNIVTDKSGNKYQ
jgi:hypothetical protein